MALKNFEYPMRCHCRILTSEEWDAKRKAWDVHSIHHLRDIDCHKPHRFTGRIIIHWLRNVQKRNVAR